MTRAMSFWMTGLLALLPLGFSAQAADAGVTMLHKMDFEAVMSGDSSRIAPKDLGSGARAFPMSTNVSTNGGITFDATKAAGWNGSTNALGTGSSGIRFRNGNGLGASTGTGWTLSFQAQAAGAPDDSGVGPIGMTLGKVGEGDNLSLHLNVNISNSQGYALVVKRANTTDIAADKAAVTVTEGTNMAPFAANEWHHYAVRCVPDAGGGQPTFELWQDRERKGAITVAGITDGTWVVKELLIGRTRGDGHLSTPEPPADANYQSAPVSMQSLDEVALFDRALSAAGVAWLKDHAAAVPPTERPASVLGAVLGTMNTVNVSNASVSTIKFGGSELALNGLAGAEAIRAGTKLERVAVLFRSGSPNGARNQNAKYLVLTDTSGVVLGVSDAAEPTPVAETIMTVAYTFTEAPTIDGTSSYRIYLTAQENLAAGDTFNTANAVTARFMALQKAASSADFTFNTEASQYAPAMSFRLYVPPRALNVNFTVGESPLVEGTDYGVAPYPAAQWRNMTTENRGGDTGTITFSEALRDTTGSEITVTATARKLETQTGESAVYPLFRDTLVDSGEAAATVKVTLLGIPYKLYDVYVYMTANDWTKNGSIMIGDDTTHHYYMADGAMEASVAESATAWGDATSAAWGTPTLGKNVLCIRNLSGNEVKLTTWRGNPARGNITAIQVVEVPTSGLTVWSATLSGDHLASTQPFTNTRGETKLLSELTEDDRAELTVAGAATLTLDAAAAPGQFALLGGGTLTLAGAQTLTTDIEVNEGTLAVAADAAALEGSTIKVASTAVLAPRATLSAQVTGAGSVTIEAGQTAALSNAENDFTGGTVVNGTLLWQGVAAYGTGAVTVNAGGVFDLNGLPCAQAVTLNGGTLKGSEVRHVASVNFYSNVGAVVADEQTGLVPVLGSYWVETGDQTSGTADLKVVPAAGAAQTGTAVETWSGALSWRCNNVYDDAGRNTPDQTTQYLRGYLDDGAVSGGRANVTLTIPEDFAARRYTLYIYSSCDTKTQFFSARDITGDSGTTTSYTYVNGALTQGTTAWGNARTGRTTVAEGTNVMVLPSLTDRSLKVEFMNRSGRGGLAAIQAVFDDVTYSGSLTVAADSVLEVPEAGKTLYLFEATVSGSGKLTKRGAGELRVVKSSFGAQTLAVAEGTCTVGEGNTLEALKVTVASGAQLTAEAGVSAISVASLAGAGTVELGDLTALTLTGSGAGTVAFEGDFTAATRDATLANAVCALIKQGTNTQVLAQLPTTLTFEVQAQAGTLKVNAATAQTLERLVTTGGTFATDGVGEISVEFAQMASGAANFASRATAQSARPAMEGAGDATVSKFTLAEGGTILYYSRADLAKFFPAGFIPEGDYTVQLGADLYSELSFPYIFTVMGAPATARFTVLASTGAPAPEGSWSASGNTITLNDSSAITGAVDALGNPKYHFAFDGNLTSDGTQMSPTWSGGTFGPADNSQAIIGGTPWTPEGSFKLDVDAWSCGMYFRLMEMAPNATLVSLGNVNNAGTICLARAAQGNALSVWYFAARNAKQELFTIPLAGSSQTWNHVLLVRTAMGMTAYLNGEQVAIYKGEMVQVPNNQMQVGAPCGGTNNSDGLGTWNNATGQIDDLAVWHSALVGKQVTDAAAKVMGKWRWREGETPALALDAAATDWQKVDGTRGAWPGTSDDPDYTAAVSFTTSATLEELVDATKDFNDAREVLWDGAAVTFDASETPAGAPRLAVANDLTVDLAGVEQALLKAAYSTPAQMKLADGVYSGEITLRNVPDGLQVTVATGTTGLTVQVALETPSTGEAYERTLTGNDTWNATGAWTKLADGTTVDVPPEGATLFLTVTADTTLTMGSERPKLANLFVDGAGALTLDYANLSLAAGDYADVPFERTLLTVTAGLPENLTIRTSALNYGAYATVTYTETEVVATVNAPEGLWQESDDALRILSINFADSDAGNSLSGTAQEGLPGYEVHAALWDQFTYPRKTRINQTGLTLHLYDFADRANGSATGTELASALSVKAWEPWHSEGKASQGLLKGYLDDGQDGVLDSTAVTVALPADWAAHYTAIVYRTSATESKPFTPQLINDKWYSYVDGALTVAGTDPAVRPGAEYDWGSTSVRDRLEAGVNTVEVSGLTDRTFSVKSWTQRGDWLWGWSARGGLAAIQLKEEKGLVPGDAKTFIAKASGNMSWASLQWRDENGEVRGPGDDPGANDAATIVLTGDLSLNLSGVAVKHLTIYGNGHAVSFGHRSEATAGTWAFVNDTTLALTQTGETLPANTVVYPKRVRYVYPYGYVYPYEGAVETTARYEQEFAAGFKGTLTPQGGLVEFSGGAVHFTGLVVTGTETDFIFSGNTVVTLADGVPFSFGTANLTFKDNAKVTAEAMRLCDEGAGRTVNLTMQDDATITVTGSENNAQGGNALLWPHRAGTLNASLRGNAKLVAKKAALTVGVADSEALQGRLTLADNAEVRVAGLRAKGGSSGGSVALTLNGGRLLLGQDGIAKEASSPAIALTLNGGSIGAWQEVTLGEDAAAAFASVTGNPIFETEATLTLTRPAPFLADPATRATLRSGGLVLQGKDFAAISALQLQGGTLTLANCSPAMSSLTLSGGTLELAAGFPTVSALNIPVDTIIHLPLREKLSEGGYITMADGRQIPAIAHAVFELALDPNRAETSRVLPLVPLVLGGYTEGTEPQVKGFGVLNNTNSAISDYAAVFQSGSAGRGLYASLKGNEVLKEHTVHLNAATEAQGGYPLFQSTLDAYPYHVFSGDQPNAKIIVPKGGVALPHAAFIGNPITIVAQGSTPAPLLQGINYTFSTDITFDLSAWATAMPEVVRGAVKGVPASLCLISGGVVKAPASVRLKANLGPYTLPSGMEGSVEVTAQGVYYVVRYERRVRTLSVNFTESTEPLVATPAQVGAYVLPVSGWNSLEGVFSSATLKLSDVGGVAQEAATAVDDSTQPTQLLCYTSQTNRAPDATASLLQVRLDDSTAQQLRLVNVPFEAYRVVLIFANDLEGAAYATATINGSSYAMDAEGYTRRDIAGYTALDAKGNPTIDIPADTQWGSTNFTPLSAPVALGTNALVSDVLTTSAVTIDLPGFTYAQRYAGLAALQILEAPDSTAAGQVLMCAYTFPDNGDYTLSDLPLTGSATTWANGPENHLFLTSDHNVTLTLPKGFEADRIVCAGSGSITLRVEGNGGAALRELDAEQLANITVDFPAADVVFSPASKVSRFEQSFNNKGNTYTIAAGATLALGEHSGIITEFDDNGTATLNIDEAGSRGTLRRDYPVTQTSNILLSYMTFAFKQGSATRDPNNSAYNILVEEGDTFRNPNRFHLQNQAGQWTYTQTGGQASFESTAGDGGMLIFNNGASANSTATILLRGNRDTRLDATMIWAWKDGAHVDIALAGEATLALGAQGLRTNGAGRSLELTVTERGTLEAKDATLMATSGATTTFNNGGRLTTKQPEANFTLPLVFTGTEAPTIIAPEPVSTILLSGANSGSGKLVVEQGTLAIANASALGNASVTVEAGATFESRNFTSGLSGKVSFAEGSTCSATSVTEPTGDYIAQIAGSIAFPADRSTVTFRLNGKAYTVADGDVDTANGTVIFRSAAQLPFEAVTWNTSGLGGEWAEGNGTPWVDTKRYWNGVGVTFPANPKDAARTVGPIRGHLRPGALTMPSAGDGYTFTSDGGLQGFLDLRDCVVDKALDLGGGVIYDVPIALASPAVKLRQGSLTLRLLGVMSNDKKTATLVGSGNLNDTQANHGVWAGADDYNGNITWSPHAGETQILGAFGTQLAGDRTVTIAGQVAADGSVSGGTVQIAGATPGTNWNANFSGAFEVRDGATLDFTMTRASDGDDNPDNDPDKDPYFRVNGNSLADRDQPVFTLSNGATLRFSKCRNILGGYGQRANASLIARQPIVIGYKSTLDYSYTADNRQELPYGLRFNGDGANVQINEKKAADRQGIFIARGATLTVAGIGDAGDLADPATDKSMVTDPDTGAEVRSPTYGRLTRGITATIDGLNEDVGLVRWNGGIPGRNDIVLEVGEGSTLRLRANLTHPGNASSNTVAFYKQGTGRLTLEHPTIAARNTIVVKEGILGGSAELTHADSAITVESGATIEGGLRVSSLTIDAGATLALDATGVKPLRCDRALFTANGTVTVASLLPADEIPSAVGREPVKVMSWNAAQAVDSVNFVLSEALSNAGYGLQVRNDGLYLMRNVVYVRELSFEDTPDKVVAAWFAPTGWYRQEDPDTLRDFDPAENETATALFLLPSDRYTANSVAPALLLNLTREANFSTVRVGVKVSETVTDGGGNTVTREVVRLLQSSVTYSYVLTNEPMPGAGEAYAFTWVSTRLVEGPAATSLAGVTASVPTGYAYTQLDTTVVVYASATSFTPALNLNFTGKSSGDPAWVSLNAGNCGAVPYAGVYWNNLAANGGDGTDFVAKGNDGRQLLRAYATVAGVTTDEGQAATCEVSFISSGAETVSSRRGDGNVCLSASFLKGQNVGNDAALLAAGGLSAPGVNNGWQVMVKGVPFKDCDLYLLFAGTADGPVTYPAVRVKVGSGDWRTYSVANDFVAPADRTDVWRGNGSLVSGNFVNARNMLHLRLNVANGEDIEVCSIDEGQLGAPVSVGLAALQLVQCTDGVSNDRLGTGNWSDPAGWARETADGQVKGRWIDATDAAPRWAKIPTTSYLTADMVASTPYLRITGGSDLLLNGTEGVLSTGTVDLYTALAGAKVSFAKNLFATAPNVVMAPDVTVCLPESAGSTTCDFRWVYDDVTRTGTASTEATIQKTQAGELTLTRKNLNKLQIDDGTLWLDSTKDGDYTRSAAITGQGTLGKTGIGAMTLEADSLQLDGVIGLHVSQGTLNWIGGSRTYPAGQRHIIDGGTLVYDGSNAGEGSANAPTHLPNAVFEVSNGATFRFKGNNAFRKSLPSVTVKNATLESNYYGGNESRWGDHPHIGSISLQNGTVSIVYDSGWFSAWDRQGLVIHGSLNVESGSNNRITLKSDKGDGLAFSEENTGLVVAAGATITSHVGISGVNLSNDDPRKFTKRGPGTWIQAVTLFGPGRDLFEGVPIDVEGGTFSYRIGGATHTLIDGKTDATITVKAGARLEGNVVFPAGSPILIEEGGTLAPYVPGVVTSSISAQKLTLNSGAILEFDLANTTGGALKNAAEGSVTFVGNLTVRLVNLPNTFTNEVQLTNFTVAPTTAPTISCPEAVALDATVQYKADAHGVNQLFLVPSGASYTWADKNGSWSEAEWQHGDAVKQSFPGREMGDATPPARIQASTSAVNLAVDKGTRTPDGKDWAMTGLVLTAAANWSITLTEALEALADPLPNDIALNRLVVKGALWKLGDGSATVAAPIAFHQAGEGSVNLAASTLTLKHPLLIQRPVNTGTLTTVPVPIDIAAGATLEYALGVSADEGTVIAAQSPTYDFTTQTLSGEMTGAGTLRLSGANNTLTLTGKVDNSLAYEVTGAGATLTLSGTIPETTPAATRTLTLAAGTFLSATTESAFGWSPWAATLAASADNGARVSTNSNARFRGSVEVTGTGTATFGTTQGYLDGTTTFEVPANATLTLGGSWQSPADVATTDTLTKRGAGTLAITGAYASNLPLTVEAGTVEVSGTVAVDELSDVVADWTLEAGTTLRLANGNRLNLNKGSLLVSSGATLDLAGQSREVVGRVTLQSGAVIRLGDGTSLGTTTFKSAVSADGTIWVNLDALDPATFGTASGTKSYTVLTFEDGGKVNGTGVFRLGGEKQVAWAQAGWTLRTSGSNVILEAFGANSGVYTWAGTADAHAWSDAVWVLSDIGVDKQRRAWPSDASLKPYVAFLDKVIVANSDNTEMEEEVPEAAHSIARTVAVQTLGGLRCANDGFDYTLSAEGAAGILSIDGELLKTGTQDLTFSQAVSFGANGALKLLGGRTCLEGALSASSGDFKKPLTLAGGAELAFNYVSGNAYLGGLFTGDGTGTLRFNSPGSLTVVAELKGLATLAVEKGSVVLTAAEQLALDPEVQLAEQTTLAYNPSTLAQGGAVKLRVNPTTAAAGILSWGAGASNETAKAPRLTRADGVPDGVPSVNVAELRYAPASGHLILDPGHAVLPASAKLTMNNSAAGATAFWMGASTAQGTTLDYAGLTGSGLIGVEPVVDLAADSAWRTTRTLTLDLDPTTPDEARIFRGTFAGALTLDSTRVDAALTVNNADTAAGDARFVLAGASESPYLGPLTVGKGTRVDVTGSWFGPVAVDPNGGELGGSGTVASGNNEVTIPEGGLITASAIGPRVRPDGSTTTELMPATLTVGGTLSLVPGSKLRVVIRNNAQEVAETSCVQAERLRLPTIVEDPNNEVKLQVVIDDENGAVASNTKILGWNTIDGASKINGELLYTDNTVRTDYVLRQKSDGLYLYRSNTRFWLLVR